MKKLFCKTLVLAISFMLISSAFAQQPTQTANTVQANGTTPPISCYDFLKNTLVEDQLYEDFDEHADFNVQMNQQQNFCTLTIKMPDGKTYEFSSVSPENFIYAEKSIALYLYEKNHPKIKNTIEADYEFDQILDVATDFPILEE
ncbi:MAG: hypothetical protein JW855_02375 [Gammaproteobacteria bacterium]|nr:hypothetical protein [Gammaproteobacteria bacterium]